jgi:signal transduction histidine kinase
VGIRWNGVEDGGGPGAETPHSAAPSAATTAGERGDALGSGWVPLPARAADEAPPRDASKGVPPIRPRLPAARRLWLGFAVAALYFAGGKLGLLLAFPHPSATAVWPPTAIALAATLAFGYRVWPWIFLGAFLTNIATEGSAVTASGIAIGNTSEAVVGTYLVNRFGRGLPAFDQPATTLAFVLLAGIFSTTISATVGVVSLAATGYADWAGLAPIWLTWWLGDASSDLIFAPALICWWRDPGIAWRPAQAAEAAILCLLLLGAAAIVFAGVATPAMDPTPLSFLCLPFIFWAAFRFTPRETATATLMLSAFAIWGTLQGHGPFVRAIPADSLLLLQTFMATTAVTAMLLASGVVAKRLAEATVRQSRDDLEAEVSERTVELRGAVEALSKETAGHRRTEEERRRSAERLQSLSRRLLQIQESERRHIARELHDEIGQCLTALKIGLRSLSASFPSSDAQRQIEENLGLVDLMLDTVRDLSLGLRPSLLDDLGLVAALGWLVDRHAKRQDVTVTFDAGSLDGRWPAEIENACFRIAQEALTNAMRHSRAKRVDLALRDHGGTLGLQVRDDGVGFDTEAAMNAAVRGESFGLLGMRERAELAGGTLEIVSSREEGTRIAARFPLSSAVEEPAADATRLQRRAREG